MAINVHKLFVRVSQSSFDSWKSAVENGTSLYDPSKIYFLADGRIFANGTYYGGELSNEELNDLLATVQKLDGDASVEGSVKQQLNAAIESIVKSEENGLVDKLEEIIKWFGDIDEDEESSVATKLIADVAANKAAIGVKSAEATDESEAVEATGLYADIEELQGVDKSLDSRIAQLEALHPEDVATLEEADQALSERLDVLEAEDKVLYTPAAQGAADRKQIALKNHDVISSVGCDGSSYAEGLSDDITLGSKAGQWANIAMLSKWNVVDLADSKFHTNINTVDKEAIIEGLTSVSTTDDGVHAVKTVDMVPAVKINDSFTIATRNELVAVAEYLKGLSSESVEELKDLIGTSEDTAAEDTVFGAIAKESDRASEKEQEILDTMSDKFDEVERDHDAVAGDLQEQIDDLVDTDDEIKAILESADSFWEDFGASVVVSKSVSLSDGDVTELTAMSAEQAAKVDLVISDDSAFDAFDVTNGEAKSLVVESIVIE